MQHHDSFQVRIHQLTPDLTDVGTSLDEAKTLRQEHQDLTAKLHVSIERDDDDDDDDVPKLYSRK